MKRLKVSGAVRPL